MSKTEDIRWIQRLNYYINALAQLEEAVNLARENQLSNLEKQGLVQAFEFTHELAWKVMKDFFAYQGNSAIHGSRDAGREAFNANLIKDGHIWMDMITSRNKTSHTYDEETVEEIYTNITEQYLYAFVEFKNKMIEPKNKELAHEE